MEMTVKIQIIYRRIIYCAIILECIFLELLGNDKNFIKALIAIIIFTLGLFASEIIIKKYKTMDNDKFRAILVAEIVACNVFQLLFSDKLTICIFILAMFDFSYEYLICEKIYNDGSHMYKKLVIIFPCIFNVIIRFSMYESDRSMLGYLILQILVIVGVFYLSDLYMGQDTKNEKILSKLTLEKNDMERVNEQLLEYQDKIKSVNEQINYQKIDLSRAISELERVNAEAKSQAEVMKYMASTFNITKCMSVIADSVMEIRKAKICALFVDGESFMSKFPSSVINTNYTSMQTRLNKDFEKIFLEVSANKEETRIYKGEKLKRFRFIGEANIAALAVFPIDNGERIYGVMLVGSDKEDFFDKGLAYFETNLAELNIAVKSIRLYLQMQDMARKDGLTGIYNRIYFKELFKEAADNAVSRNTPLSVALYDIDKFKSVNDTYGHLAGDEVIKMVASTGARYAERFGGFACRYGGEEFLLVLPGFDEKEALSVLEEMHEEIKSTKVVYNNIAIDVNCCIGLSTYPNICKNVELLVNRSDKAMYYGKKNGRGRLVLDNPSIDDDNL